MVTHLSGPSTALINNFRTFSSLAQFQDHAPTSPRHPLRSKNGQPTRQSSPRRRSSAHRTDQPNRRFHRPIPRLQNPPHPPRRQRIPPHHHPQRQTHPPKVNRAHLRLLRCHGHCSDWPCSSICEHLKKTHAKARRRKAIEEKARSSPSFCPSLHFSSCPSCLSGSICSSPRPPRLCVRPPKTQPNKKH